MLVFKELNQHKVPLYLIAGVESPAMKAEKALRKAYEKHGGKCFYCSQGIAEGQMTIDHAEPQAIGGTDNIQNLIVSCQPCNRSKNNRAIELFKPDKGRDWLLALKVQIEDRLKRLPS